MSSFTKTASVVWSGTDKGAGVLTSESPTLQKVAYSREARFSHEPKSSPEELLAAAHAACFSIAFDDELQLKGFKAEELKISCSVTITSVSAGFSVTKSALDMKATIPGIHDEEFQIIAAYAMENCPVSKLFDTEIVLKAVLLD